MTATVVLTPVGGVNSTVIDVTVTVTGGLLPPFDFVFFWTDFDDEVPLVVSSSLRTLTVRHTYDPPGDYDIVVGVIPHGDDPEEARGFREDFFEDYGATVVYPGFALPCRQWPRDDFVGGAPREGDGSRSVQASARQGVNGVYL